MKTFDLTLTELEHRASQHINAYPATREERAALRAAWLAGALSVLSTLNHPEETPCIPR